MERVRFSHLKAMGRSAQHYLEAVRDSQKATRGMNVGAIGHALALGGELVVYPGKVRRGKQWDAFAAEHRGERIVLRSEYEQGAAVADAIRNHRLAAPLLEGHRELTLQWEMQGLKCRGTPDVRTHDYIVELKLTADGRPERFDWHAKRMHYFAQLDWYQTGCEYAGVPRPREAYMIVAEMTPPYVVTVRSVERRALEQGHRTWRLWFETLRGCVESDEWPGYCESILPIDVPDDDTELTFADDEEAA